MATANIYIEKCVQDIQEAKVESEMRSRIYFSMSLDGQIYNNLTVDILQAYGADYVRADIDIEPIKGYQGSFNLLAFKQGIESYYRALIRERASITSLGKGVLRTADKVFNYKHQFEMNIE